MQCEEARDLLIQRWLGEIEPEDDRVLARHISGCTACRDFEAAQVQVDRQAAGLENLHLPSQRRAILAQLPRSRQTRWTYRLATGLAGLAAAAAVTFFALSYWQMPNPAPPPAAPVGEKPAPSRPVDLPATFLTTQLKPGAGWVATAAVPTAGGTAAAYYYVEPAGGDRLHAMILLRRPDGRLTREIDLGEVSFGQLPFTQPEFRLLKVGDVVLLAMATDDGAGTGLLRVAAYNPVLQQLLLVPFDERGTTALPVTTWPTVTDEGIRTYSGNWQVDWRLTSAFAFERAAEATRETAAPGGGLLAETALDTASGRLTVRLEGTLTEGAWLGLYDEDGALLQQIDLGKPHYGDLPMTRPALSKLQVGDREVIAILSDPMVGQPRQAVVRVFAYDPGRRQLRLTPFATGELLVEEPLSAQGDLLLAGYLRWKLSDHWLLEPVQ
ncbi:MAG TPA: zf-HC2 domain-containing protein [Symbiobacteriaceae bacterium]|nr:zf-HC2 domain-containing protein [Symbiobacteriaceae bacterium]